MWRLKRPISPVLKTSLCRQVGQRVGEDMEWLVYAHTEGVLGPIVSFTQSLPDPAVHSALSLILNNSSYLVCQVCLHNKLFTYTRNNNPVDQTSLLVFH